MMRRIAAYLSRSGVVCWFLGHDTYMTFPHRGALDWVFKCRRCPHVTKKKMYESKR